MKKSEKVTGGCSEVKSINLSTYLKAKLNFQKSDSQNKFQSCHDRIDIGEM